MSSSMPIRRGVVWISNQVVMVQPNFIPCGSHAVKSPMMQRGKGWRLPTSSAFQPLRPPEPNNDGDNGDDGFPHATANEMIDGINWFHDQNLHPKCVCFGGAYSEPLASFSAVAEAMRVIRERRQTLPMAIMTSGLCHRSPVSEKGLDANEDGDESRQNADISRTIIGMHEEWRDATASDGDSKLSVFVSLGGSTPSEYEAAMGGDEICFRKVCAFVSNLTEAGARVYGTASEHPSVENLKRVKDFAIMGLGCADLFVQSYHPRTLYDVLEIPEGTSDKSVIKEANRAKANVLHPNGIRLNDKAELLMKEVTEAYDILSDEKLRGLYENGVADLSFNDQEEDYFRNVVNKSI